MDKPQANPRAPIGLAFEIADLTLLRDWAVAHGMRMVVELDHSVEGEEYEEVVAFYARESQLRRWIVWRACDAIIVQPLIGRSTRFESVAHALEGLLPARP